ncbi:MAG: 1-(5-phosphoribosyl)-5-((5-phosphoribosylamino)methylideneamino)imidazole-4-carboxamide isomerase, partial [Alphaproteobacteria bacterium]|nr:1-(5-phosphoribosyl)-5-((5-phosphoribosylamino)methylideneamino)imidazole-4-carboxamide isomerase [Alphaproteobacteria bacterium]
MIIYPAIDLIDGKCVRLHKGDFARQTTYNFDPVDITKAYKQNGAKWLHVVDLDGAKNPVSRQTGLITKII